MQIVITAECFVKYAKIVDVSESDFLEYQRIIDDDDITERERARKLEALAEKYRLAHPDNQVDMDELEEVTFEPVRSKN